LVATSSDKTIVAVLSGKVIHAGWDPESPDNRNWEWGNYVTILSED
jgi:murein DD-endopeptidase MepM/ murein hydrolase activator NlpD